MLRERFFPLFGGKKQEKNSSTTQKEYPGVFDTVEDIQIEGEATTLFKIRPKETPPYEKPVLFCSGCACTALVYDHALHEIAENGYCVTTFNHPPMRNSPQLNVLEKKSKNISHIVESENLKEILAVAHSEGCINLVDAVMKHPDRYHGLVLIAPAGLMGKDSLLRLTRGFFHEMKTRPETLSGIPETRDEEIQRQIGRQETERYVANAPLQTLHEIQEIAHSQIQEKLERLHNLGIGIVIIALADDNLFPQEPMQKIMNGKYIDGYYVVRGKHGTIGTRSELYQEVLKEALEFLRKRERKPKASISSPSSPLESATTKII